MFIDGFEFRSISVALLKVVASEYTGTEMVGGVVVVERREETLLSVEKAIIER
jgi:hypothetical protein